MITDIFYSNKLLRLEFNLDDEIHIDIWNEVVDFVLDRPELTLVPNHEDFQMLIDNIDFATVVDLLCSVQCELEFINDLDNYV